MTLLQRIQARENPQPQVAEVRVEALKEERYVAPWARKFVEAKEAADQGRGSRRVQKIMSEPLAPHGIPYWHRHN